MDERHARASTYKQAHFRRLSFALQLSETIPQILQSIQQLIPQLYAKLHSLR
jgi:hypothetical protein